MSKMNQVYGIGQALISSLPPPIGFQNPPTSSQTNFEIGQVVFTPQQNPTAFYIYGGAGNWIQFSSSSGSIIAINGTANQVTASTTSGTTTLSIPTTFVAPGSVQATGNIIHGTGSKDTYNTVANSAAAGANTAGTVALSAGTVVVSTTAVTANSLIRLTCQALGTVTAPSALAVTAKSAGVSFTILASQGTDTSTIFWEIVN